jgi:hypothetical protein
MVTAVESVMEEVLNLKRFVQHVKELNPIVQNHFLATAPIAAVFQVFRAVTVITVDHFTSLANGVAGGVLRSTFLTLSGVLRRTMHPMPGDAVWVTSMVMCTGATDLRQMGFQFAVSGINFTLSLSKGYLIIC